MVWAFLYSIKKTADFTLRRSAVMVRPVVSIAVVVAWMPAIPPVPIFIIYALLGDILEYLEPVVPYHLYSGDEQTLIGSVYIAQCGAETYHVEVGVAL